MSTIERRLHEFHVAARSFYFDIDDETLDRTIRDISRSFPSAGYRQMTGFLLSRGIKVQQERIRGSMCRVDPVGVLIRSLELSTSESNKVTKFMHRLRYGTSMAITSSFGT